MASYASGKSSLSAVSDDVNLSTNVEKSYVNTVKSRSELKITQKQSVRSVFEPQGNIGLFFFFFPRSDIERIQSLINRELSSKAVSMCEIWAFVGLTQAIFVRSLPRISDYW